MKGFFLVIFLSLIWLKLLGFGVLGENHSLLQYLITVTLKYLLKVPSSVTQNSIFCGKERLPALGCERKGVEHTQGATCWGRCSVYCRALEPPDTSE